MTSPRRKSRRRGGKGTKRGGRNKVKSYQEEGRSRRRRGGGQGLGRDENSLSRGSDWRLYRKLQRLHDRLQVAKQLTFSPPAVKNLQFINTSRENFCRSCQNGSAFISCHRFKEVTVTNQPGLDGRVPPRLLIQRHYEVLVCCHEAFSGITLMPLSFQRGVIIMSKYVQNTDIPSSIGWSLCEPLMSRL